MPLSRTDGGDGVVLFQPHDRVVLKTSPSRDLVVDRNHPGGLVEVHEAVRLDSTYTMKFRQDDLDLSVNSSRYPIWTQLREEDP